MNARELLLEIEGLKTWFPIRAGLLQRPKGYVRAVDGVSFNIFRGETLALVGESGCGKTTVGRTILRLVEPEAGAIRYRGENILDKSGRELLDFRRKVQMVFQDPMTSLNPRLRVQDLVGEGLVSFGIGADAQEREERVRRLIERVQLSPDHLRRFPHEFSGGQRQRIGIARALAVEPELVVCDEAVSALDVSIQAQILNLLSELQQELGVAYLFITHDLSVVRHLAHRVAVMYLGQVVEEAPTSELFEHPRHPYTEGLLAAVPSRDPKAPRLTARVLGDVPSPANPPSGCRFHTRCPKVRDVCRTTQPELIQLGASRVACHFPNP